jgi:hypothetical protein
MSFSSRSSCWSRRETTSAPPRCSSYWKARTEWSRWTSKRTSPPATDRNFSIGFDIGASSRLQADVSGPAGPCPRHDRSWRRRVVAFVEGSASLAALRGRSLQCEPRARAGQPQGLAPLAKAKDRAGVGFARGRSSRITSKRVSSKPMKVFFYPITSFIRPNLDDRKGTRSSVQVQAFANCDHAIVVT